jgi:5-(carboxyamino)imidazole ribonucleotide synthase
MVGGGQLARMTAQAAVPLGVTVTVLDPDPSPPAARAGAHVLVGRADRLDDLLALARVSDVITFDHERVPLALLGELEERGHRVAPGPATAELAFDKAASRQRLRAHGYPVPRFSVGSTVADVVAFGDEAGWPVVVKAASGGYDGRGVAIVDDIRSVEEAVRLLGHPLVVEELVAFDVELAVMVARSAGGEVACYPPVATIQRDAMCAEVVAPAPVPASVRRAACELAESLAAEFELVGVMAVELFLVGAELVINELATRPHNTAHHTIQAAETSQIEQHLRAVLGWPLGATRARARAAAMVNVVGAADGSDPQRHLPQALALSGAPVHLYGKDPRPGRKLGHVTALGATIGQAREVANRAAALLGSPDPCVHAGGAA